MFGNKLSKVEKLTAKKNAAGLIPLTASKSEEIKLAAIRGLSACESDEAFNALVPLVHDASAAVRKTAVSALADMNRPAGRVHIEHQMKVEKDAQVLSAMQTALGKSRTIIKPAYKSEKEAGKKMLFPTDFLL